MRNVGISLAVTLAISTAALAASNDFQIQSVSGTTTLKPGDTFASGARVNVPAGVSLQLIDRTGGQLRMRQCLGPHSGTIESCPAAASAPRSGVSPGGTRGAMPVPDSEPPKDDAAKK